MHFGKLLGYQVFSKTTIAIRFNFLQVCPSVPPFVLDVLSLPCFNVLSCYFHVSLSFVAAPTV